MPTANANTGNGFSKAVSYALQEQKQLPEDQRAVVLEYNNVFGSSRDIGRQMRDIADDRERVQKPVLHLQINFHPEEKLDREQAEKAVHAILKEVGISADNHQYVLVQHRDKPHDHYHVVANRIGMDGSLVSNERIIERLQVACDKVEQEQGLRQTEGRTVFYDPSQEKGFRYATSEEKKAHRAKNKKTSLDKNPNKREQQAIIKNEVIKILQDKKIGTAEEFKQALASKGIDVRFMENKNGISGVSFKTDKISIKGSQIGAKWGDISKLLEENKARLIVKNDFVNELKKIIVAEKPTDKNQLQSILASQGIAFRLEDNRAFFIKGGFSVSADSDSFLELFKRNRQAKELIPAVIKEEVVHVLQDKAVVNIEGFKQALAEKEIDVRLLEDKDGISDLIFVKDRESVKGSAIGVKLEDISKVLQENGMVVQETKSISRQEIEQSLRADLQIAVSRCMSVGYGVNIDHILKLRGLERTPQGYSYQVNGVSLLIRSDLEKGIRDTIYESMSLQKQYEKDKAHQEKVLKAKPMEIKKVPLFFGKEIKESNAKAEAYNKRLEQEKQKIAKNPVKEPVKDRKQVLDKYIEKALKSKISIDNRAKTIQKGVSQVEQAKVTKQENKVHKRRPGYKL